MWTICVMNDVVKSLWTEAMHHRRRKESQNFVKVLWQAQSISGRKRSQERGLLTLITYRIGIRKVCTPLGTCLGTSVKARVRVITKQLQHPSPSRSAVGAGGFGQTSSDPKTGARGPIFLQVCHRTGFGNKWSTIGGCLSRLPCRRHVGSLRKSEAVDPLSQAKARSDSDITPTWMLPRMIWTSSCRESLANSLPPLTSVSNPSYGNQIEQAALASAHAFVHGRHLI